MNRPESETGSHLLSCVYCNKSVLTDGRAICDDCYDKKQREIEIKKLEKEYENTYSGDPENIYHDKFTEELSPGQKYNRPKWHGWVYGGGKNPILKKRRKNTRTANEKGAVTIGNKKHG